MTKPIISNDQAKQDKLFYVVANLIIINVADKTCLLLKRSANEKVHPEKWAFPGGKLEHADVANLLVESGNQPIDGIDNILGKLAMREAKEECGLDVSAEDAAVTKNKVFVRPDGVPVFMTILATTYQGGSVVLEEDAFTDYAWVTEPELENYDCIQGVTDEARLAIEKFCKA